MNRIVRIAAGALAAAFTLIGIAASLQLSASGFWATGSVVSAFATTVYYWVNVARGQW